MIKFPKTKKLWPKNCRQRPTFCVSHGRQHPKKFFFIKSDVSFHFIPPWWILHHKTKKQKCYSQKSLKKGKVPGPFMCACTEWACDQHNIWQVFIITKASLWKVDYINVNIYILSITENFSKVEMLHVGRVGGITLKSMKLPKIIS